MKNWGRATRILASGVAFAAPLIFSNFAMSDGDSLPAELQPLQDKCGDPMVNAPLDVHEACSELIDRIDDTIVHEGALTNRAEAAIELGWFAAAEQDYTSLIELSGSGFWRANRADALIRQGRFEEAITDLEAVIELAEDIQTEFDHGQLARIYLLGPEEIRSPDLALHHAMTAYEKDPFEHAHYAEMLAAAYVVNGRMDDAIFVYRRFTQQWDAGAEELQEYLADVGYDPGPVDGIFGPKTQAALRMCLMDGCYPTGDAISLHVIVANCQNLRC